MKNCEFPKLVKVVKKFFEFLNFKILEFEKDRRTLMFQ